LGLSVRSVLFCVLVFVVVYLWVQPKLIYHDQGQFMKGRIYVPGMKLFEDLPAYPGKPVEYVGARLSQWYYYSLSGAVIITMVAWLLCVETEKFITALGAEGLRPLRFVPPILLFVQYGRYYHYLDETLAILTALLFLYLYIRIPLRSDGLRFNVFLLFSALVYAAAVESYPVFVVLCGIFEIVKRKCRLVGLLCFVSVLLVPYITGKFIFGLHLKDAYRWLSFYPADADVGEVILVLSFFLFFPLAGFLCVLWGFVSQKTKLRTKKSKRTKNSLEHRRRNKLVPVLKTAVLLVVTGAIFFLTCKTVERNHRRIDYFAVYNMWDELLREVHELPVQEYDMFICHDVNRALYHTGRLLYDMFSYPQHYSGLLLTAKSGNDAWMIVREWVKRSATLYEVGHINEAENTATEAFVNMNYYPICLKRLVLINIVKGRTEVARAFLQVLKKDFIYRDWANGYLEKLQTDPLLSNDEQIQQLRSFMLTEDSVERTTPRDFFLNNKQNRLAFEYLIAFCLLTEQYAPVARSVRYLDNFDYPKGLIPRHLEEAILLYTAMSGNVVDLHGRQINPGTIRRFEEFAQRTEYYIQSRQNGAEALAKDFGDTYYYYYYYLLDRSESNE
jgi:hypothetical protein